MNRRLTAGLLALATLTGLQATSGVAHATNGDTLTINGSCFQSAGGRCKPYLTVGHPNGNNCGISWRLIGGSVNAVSAYATNDPYGWGWSGPWVYQNGVGNVYMPNGIITQSSNTPSTTRSFSIRYRVDSGNCSLGTVWI